MVGSRKASWPRLCLVSGVPVASSEQKVSKAKGRGCSETVAAPVRDVWTQEQMGFMEGRSLCGAQENIF